VPGFHAFHDGHGPVCYFRVNQHADALTVAALDF